jgi:hypothetical protein
MDAVERRKIFHWQESNPVRRYTDSCSEFLQSGYGFLWTLIIQGDLFERGAELMIINHAIIYRWKQNLASIYLGRCGDNWVTEDTEIGLPYPGDTGRRMLQPIW